MKWRRRWSWRRCRRRREAGTRSVVAVDGSTWLLEMRHLIINFDRQRASSSDVQYDERTLGVVSCEIVSFGAGSLLGREESWVAGSGADGAVDTVGGGSRESAGGAAGGVAVRAGLVGQNMASSVHSLSA